MNPTLLNVVKSYKTNKGIIIAQDLICRSGIMRTMFFGKASNDSYDLVDIAASLPAGSFRLPGAGYSVSNPTSAMQQIDLFPFGAFHQLDANLVKRYKGGLGQYIKDKSPGYAEGLGQSFSAQLVYGFGKDANGFKGLRQIAIENSKNVTAGTAGSGSGSVYATILFVKWHREACTGLFNEVNFKSGKLFIPTIENNGKIVWIADPNDATKKMPVYQFATEADFGIKVLSTNNVYAITGLKNASTFEVTLKQLKSALRAIKAETDGSTFIYCNSEGARQIDLVNPAPQQSVDTLDKFNKVPIVIDDNITQTEAWNA